MNGWMAQMYVYDPAAPNVTVFETGSADKGLRSSAPEFQKPLPCNVPVYVVGAVGSLG